MVLTGWFYGLNWYRYGDPTGSAALFDKLARPAADEGFWELLASPVWLARGFQDLLVGSDFTFMGINNPTWYGGPLPDPMVNSIAAFIALPIVVLAVGLVLRSRSRDRTSGRRRGALPGAWLSVLVLAAVPIFQVAQHMSSSGLGHSRYLLPMVPVAAAALALVARRLVWWLPLVVTTAAVIWQLTKIGAAVDARQLRLTELLPPLVHGPALGGSLAVTYLGAGVLVAGLGATTWRDHRLTRRIAPSGGSPAQDLVSTAPSAAAVPGGTGRGAGEGHPTA